MNPRNSRDRYAEERKTPIFPVRGMASKTPPAPPPPSTKPIDSVDLPYDLDREREKFGFDDIPIDAEDLSFKEIIAAWFKQGFRHSEMEDNGKRLHKKVKNSKLAAWKDDLKWAMTADLDEESLPKKSKSPTGTSPAKSQAHTSTSQPVVQPEAINKTIDVNINFGAIPKLPPLNLKQHLAPLARFRPSRKVVIICSTLAIIAVGSVLAYQVSRPRTYVTLPDGKRVAANDPSLKDKIPQYSTITPSGKDVREFGGWGRVSPPGKEPVFAYADKLSGVPISVSQQPLPDAFKNNTSEKIADLAKGYVATDKQTVGDTTFYVGTSAKGPQSVITTKNNLLILIKSTAKIDDKKWGEYISSLE